MAEIEIRPVDPERDAEAMWRIAREPGVMENIMQLPSLRLSGTRRWLEGIGDDFHGFVAVRHGELVGSADLQVGPGRRRHSALLGITVATPHQGKGVGGALMTAILDLADNWLGLRRVELAVFPDNRAALALYERHGFELEGRARQAVSRQGALHDFLMLARLRPALTAAPDDAPA